MIVLSRNRLFTRASGQRTLSITWRSTVAVAILLSSTLLLAGCSQPPRETGELQERLRSSDSWKVNAQWVWSNNGKIATVIRGVGTWSRGGEQFNWKEEYQGVSVKAWTVGDELHLEDGSVYPIQSERARKRIEHDLFYALDPLEIARRHGITLNVEGGKLTGSGRCIDQDPPCIFNIVVSVDSQLRPTTVHTTMKFSASEEQIIWSYYPDA
jgi:hypothetical protein